MKVARHILAEAISERILTIRDPKLLAKEIAAYLLQERRTSDLESILRDIMQHRTDLGVVEAEVVSAHPVGENVLSEVRSILKSDLPGAKSVHMGTRIDPSLVGGIRVDMANQQLDMSIQSKLTTFKRFTMKDGV